jgi:multidrug resistance efflux pump
MAVVLQLQATALSHEDGRSAATAVATELATLLHCERVSIGFVQGASTTVEAVSHSPSLEAERALFRDIAAAMDEAIDQGATLVHPLPAGSQPRIVRAHAQLARAQASGALCSVPLVDQQQLIGAITLERAQAGFGADDVALCEHVACLLGPVLQLKRRNGRSLLRHALDALQATRRRLLGPGHPVTKLTAVGAAALLLLAGALAALPGDYRVSASARIEGAVQRALVAPTDGFIHLVHARPGDSVRAGDVLAELATDELGLERQKWQSEQAQHEHGYSDAMARHDRAQMVIALARSDEARAKLELVEQALQRSRLEAPFDGTVIKGDLSQSLGAPVKRGDVLLMLAQGQGHRVIVEVDERDIGEVKLGQGGRLALAASPQSALPIRVQRITPVASTLEGRNVFEVEAAVEDAAGQLRPGLQGVAKIDVGRRPLLWIATHRAVNWLRLAWWSWLG